MMRPGLSNTLYLLFFTFNMLTVLSLGEQTCADIESKRDCVVWKSVGYCTDETYEPFMRKNCNETCGVCESSTTSCPRGQFSCQGGSPKCVPVVRVCDCQRDCENGHDESDCSSFPLRCNHEEIITSVNVTEIADVGSETVTDIPNSSGQATAENEGRCIVEIDAAFNHPTEKHGYIISGGQYMRVEADEENTPVVSEGFPQLVTDQWPGVDRGQVEAAFTDYLNGRTFFFVKSEPRRKVFCWNWNSSEMEIDGDDEGNTVFAGLPPESIKGIASYRDYVLFLFEEKYFLWTPEMGLHGEPQSWPRKTGDESVHVRTFDTFLRGYHQAGSQSELEKYMLIRSRELVEEATFVEKFSYDRFEEALNLQMCS